jgi:hypothetical protein
MQLFVGKKVSVSQILSIWMITLIMCGFFACKNDEPAEGTDQELFSMAKETAGFTWYKNSNSLLSKSAGSGHPQPFLKTRYNSIAASKLTSAGKIQSGASFPEGSLIVKELYENATTLDRYAILYKKSTSPDADAKGWVWGYINANGTVSISANQKGQACISCHSQADHIDYMLMNKYFP